uniref:CCHC-type domain-containing protein n=1 Tax=Nothobranchius kadleci TaxID=1051664 RepID=A0A1A8DN40_NOTKA
MSWVRHLPRAMTESSGHTSNPAESALADLATRMSQQEQTLPVLMEQLNVTNQRYQRLETVLQQLQEQLSSTASGSVPAPATAAAPAFGTEPHAHASGGVVSPGPEALGSPEITHFRSAPPRQCPTFSGEFEDCFGFLLQCRLAFEDSPRSFPTDSMKISFIVGLLRGKALRWAEAKSRNPNFLSGSYPDFLEDFKLTFCSSETTTDIRKRLLHLSQGRRSVVDMSLEFRTLAAMTSWGDDALKAAFIEALNDRVRNQLALCPEPSTLDGLISLCISIDKRHRELQKTPFRDLSPPAVRRPSHRSPPLDSPEEPMQVGRTHLTPEERQHRYSKGLCLYCGKPGHMVHTCPAASKGRAHQ